MNISRRDFLKGTAAGALSLAASSLIAPAAAFAEEEKAAETAEVSVHQAMAAQTAGEGRMRKKMKKHFYGQWRIMNQER